MKTKTSQVREFCLGSILLSTAWSSPAIALGQHSGGLVLGQPLAIPIEAHLAAGETVADVCVSADGSYGATKFDAPAVRAFLQRAAPSVQASQQIQATQATQAIDDPVATVWVRAGCTVPLTRRYVLVANRVGQPSGSIASPSLGGPAAVSGAPVAWHWTVAAVTQGGTLSGPAGPAANTGLVASELSPAIERDPVLKLSPTLLSQPDSSDQARAAAGRLWRAIRASPQDSVRDAEQLEARSAELVALREALTSSQAANRELLVRLEQSRRWPWLAYALAALLALALLWPRRQGKAHPDVADEDAWRESADDSQPDWDSALQRPGGATPTPLRDLDLNLSRSPVAERAAFVTRQPTTRRAGEAPSDQVSGKRLPTEQPALASPKPKLDLNLDDL